MFLKATSDLIQKPKIFYFICNTHCVILDFLCVLLFYMLKMPRPEFIPTHNVQAHEAKDSGRILKTAVHIPGQEKTNQHFVYTYNFDANGTEINYQMSINIQNAAFQFLTVFSGKPPQIENRKLPL